MEKLLAFALASKFPNLDVASILDVANATGNAAVAVEKLLGLYETPSFPEEVISSNGIKYTFKEFDAYSCKITYSYEDQQTESLYYDESMNVEGMLYDEAFAATVKFREENGGELLKKTHKFFKTNKFLTKTDTMSLDNWLRNADKKYNAKVAK